MSALDVKCPACGALPGIPCTVPTVSLTGSAHWARTDLASTLGYLA